MQPLPSSEKAVMGKGTILVLLSRYSGVEPGGILLLSSPEVKLFF